MAGAALRRSPLCLLLLLLLLAGVSPAAAGGSSSGDSSSASSACTDSEAHGRRLGSGAPWWCEAWERDYVEAAASVVMVLIAMVFEHCFHHFEHKAGKSFVYGDTILSTNEKEAREVQKIFGTPLREVLLSRMGGEFMVLGFLAFTVWSSNQLGLFDWIATHSETGTRLPKVGSDYLHLVERVHMQLFVGMILYFALAYKVVSGSCDRNREFETLRNNMIEQLKNGCPGGPEHDPPNLRAFKRWRTHFVTNGVSQVMTWREKKPQSFRKVLDCLGFHESSAFDIEEDQLRSAFQGCFSFATYLAFSVRDATVEVVRIGSSTMVGILFTKGILFLLFRFAHWSQEAILPFILGFCVVVLLLTYVLTEMLKGDLDRNEDTEPSLVAWLEKRISMNVNFDQHFLRTLQGLLFFVCYGFAGSLVSREFWEQFFNGDAVTIVVHVIYLATWAMLCILMKRTVADFSVVMSLPPFFGSCDENMVMHVLEVGGAQGSCWAPVVDEKNMQMVKAHGLDRDAMHEARGREGLIYAIRELIERPAAEEELDHDHNVEPAPGRARTRTVSDQHAHVGPKTIAQEQVVVDDLVELLTAWHRKQPEEGDRECDDVDEKSAQRLAELHRTLHHTQTGLRARSRSSVMEKAPSDKTGATNGTSNVMQNLLCCSETVNDEIIVETKARNRISQPKGKSRKGTSQEKKKKTVPEADLENQADPVNKVRSKE